MDEHSLEDYGLVVANQTSIVYAYKFKKQIDIYDLETLRLKKRIIDRYDYVNPDMESDDNVYHYTNVVAGKKYLYVLYQGRSSKNKPVNNDFIEVYDYDGNPITKYVFDNISPYLFSIDEINHVLYGFSYDYEDYLLKCYLP